MLTYTIIFLVSLFLIVGMLTARFLYRKLHDEHFFHRFVTYRARNANVALKARYRKFRRILRYFNRKTFSLFIHLVIEKIEELFHKATDFVRSMFPRQK